MSDGLADPKIFEIIYKLTHLAELYDQFVAYCNQKGLPIKSFAEFEQYMKNNGTPYGHGLSLKETVAHNTVLPIFDLYKLYQEYPDSPALSIEEFTYHHKIVDKFRRETGMRKHISD